VSVTRDDPARLAEAAAICELDGAAGLIVATNNPPADWTHETACVLLGASHPTIPAVTHDSLDALTVAVGHLGELGHQHILFVDAGLRSDSRHADAFGQLSRSEGFAGHIERLGGGPEKLDAIVDTVTSGPVTALLVSDDGIAADLVDRLRGNGLHVPRDVSVCGYNHDPERADPITSVDQGIARLVVAAHEILHGWRISTTGSEPVMVELGTTVSSPPPRRN
jgi:DNA-binding LacI/PurR family transcriptional regulator